MVKSQSSIRTTLLLIISLLNLLIALPVGVGVYDSWVDLKKAEGMKEDSITAVLLYQTMKYLSQERGASLSVLYISPETAQPVYDDILTSRKEFDESLDRAMLQLNRRPPSDMSHFVGMKEKLQILQGLRQKLDEAMKQPQAERDPQLADNIFNACTELLSEMQKLIVTYTDPLQKIDVMASRHRSFRYFVWEIGEYAGREYAVIGRAIVENKPLTQEQQQELLMWRGRIQHGWEIAHMFALSSGLQNSLSSYIDEAETHYFMTFDQIKDFFYTSNPVSPEAPYPITIEIWLELASQAVDSLSALSDATLSETQAYADSVESQARDAITINAILFVCALALSLYCLRIIISRVIQPVNMMVDALYKAMRGEPYESPPVGNREDEIGKLAEVLEVFQENIRKIEQSNVELERFAYISAHDLKSPLRAIQTLCQWIEEDLGPALQGKSKGYMTTLLGRVKRMEKLLDDTLEYSRIESKLKSQDTEIVNGKTLINDVILLSSPPKNFTVKYSDKFSDLSLPRMPLQQVLYNLVNNAIKHHDRDDGKIEIDVEETDNHYVFTVKDDGPGIEPQYHQKIFEMFQTLKSRDEREGSGMGLALVKKILTACGGDIIVDSDVGRGALFRFRWPKFKEELKHVRQSAG